MFHFDVLLYMNIEHRGNALMFDAHIITTNKTKHFVSYVVSFHLKLMSMISSFGFFDKNCFILSGTISRLRFNFQLSSKFFVSIKIK